MAQQSCSQLPALQSRWTWLQEMCLAERDFLLEGGVLLTDSDLADCFAFCLRFDMGGVETQSLSTSDTSNPKFGEGLDGLLLGGVSHVSRGNFRAGLLFGGCV